MKLCCQACGFTVYNRRYPKCESCGVVLAEGLAMSLEERRTALEADRVEAERIGRAKRERAPQDAGSDGGDPFPNLGDLGGGVDG